MTNELAGTHDKLECDFLGKVVGEHTVLCANVDKDQHTDWGSKQLWSNPLNLRWWMILQVLKHGNNVLWTDTDVVFTRSPRGTLEALAASGVDAATNFHQMSKFELNTGIGFLRSTNSTIALVEDTWARIVNETKKLEAQDPTAVSNEQQIFTDAVESKLSGTWSLRLTWDQHHNRDCVLATGLSRSGKEDPGCHFSTQGAERMKLAFTTREPVSHQGFTFQVVPDKIFGWKETLYDIYSEHRKAGTHPTAQDLPAVLHIKAGTGGHAGDKIRYLSALGMWSGVKRTANGVPPGALVPAKVRSAVPLEDQVDHIIALCARAKALGEVLVLPPVNCELPGAITVFNWPALTKYVCYHFNCYKGLGGHELWKACHHSLLAPFEVAHFKQRNNSEQVSSASVLAGHAQDPTSNAITGTLAPAEGDANTHIHAATPRAPSVAMVPVVPKGTPFNASKVGLVVSNCNHKLDWLGGEEFSCERYDVIIYVRCGQVTTVPSNVQNCTSIVTVPNKGHGATGLYAHIVKHYDTGRLHRLMAYIPGAPDCGAHSACDPLHPLSKCACLSKLQRSLRIAAAAPGVSFSTLNEKLVTVRATTWTGICDEVTSSVALVFICNPMRTTSICMT
eukprot:gene2744-3523_t